MADRCGSGGFANGEGCEGKRVRVSEPTGDHVVDVPAAEQTGDTRPANVEMVSQIPVEAGDNTASTGSGGEQRSSGDEDPALIVPVPVGLAESEIDSLLWLEEDKNKKFAAAHRAWTAKDNLFASRIDKKKKQSSSLRNEIYQLLGFYSVFQGVLFTAVAQSNLLICHNWWSAFILSLFASAVTIYGVYLKFTDILALEKTIKSESEARQVCIHRGEKLLQKRENFDFNTDANDKPSKEHDQSKLRESMWLVIGALVVFSGLFLVSIRQVLCDSGGTTSDSAKAQS